MPSKAAESIDSNSALTMNKDNESLSDLGVDAINLIMEKLNFLSDGIKKLNEENGKRAQEIATLAKYNNLIETEDEFSSTNQKAEDDLISSHKRIETKPSHVSASRNSSPSPERIHLLSNSETRTQLPAKDIVRTIEVLKGKDDCGVEDFIRTVKRARKRCSQPDLLLDFIIAEKIIDSAKRSIRFITIEDYETLYLALRQNVGLASSIELSRSRLESTRQMNTESVQSFNLRFRQQFNELNYAIQNEHTNSTARRIALQTEEKSAIKRYIMNLKEEIGSQVRPLRPVTLNLAQQEALESEIWCQEKGQARSRFGQPTLPRSNRPVTPQVQRPLQEGHIKYPTMNIVPNHSMPLQQRLQLFCSHCKKPGHKESQCYLKQRNFQKMSSPNRPPDRVNQIQAGFLNPDMNEVGNTQQEIESVNSQEIQGIEYQPSTDDYILLEDSSSELEIPENF